MPIKHKLHLALDCVALVILLSLMGFPRGGEVIHELLGVTFLCLMVLHNGLNRWWYRRLTCGTYPPRRVVRTMLNLVSIAVLATALASGLMLSRHVWPDFPWHQGDDTVRAVHMTSVHWLQMIIALHLGLHWKLLAGLFKPWQQRAYRYRFARPALRLLWISILAYGGYALYRMDKGAYLLAQVDFSFFDPGTPAAMFYVDYLAAIFLIAAVTHGLDEPAWLAMGRQHRRRY